MCSMQPFSFLICRHKTVYYQFAEPIRFLLTKRLHTGINVGLSCIYLDVGVTVCENTRSNWLAGGSIQVMTHRPSVILLMKSIDTQRKYSILHYVMTLTASSRIDLYT